MFFSEEVSLFIYSMKEKQNRRVQSDKQLASFVCFLQIFAICGTSSCPRSYNNLQSIRRHVRDKRLSFFEMHWKVFDKDLPHNLDLSQRDENDFRPVESIVCLKKILG